MDDTTNDYEKSAFDTPDDAALYVECIRLIEGSHVRRFENAANKFDLVQYELNDGVSKSLLFYAIEHNNVAFVKTLLDMEVPLNKKYTVMIPTAASSESQLVQKTLNAYEYACELQYNNIADLIQHRTKLPPYEQRFFRMLKLNDIRRCETFIHRLHNKKRQNEIAKKGLFYAAQLGSIRLLDYFLTNWKIDINTQQEQNNEYSTTALLTSITYNQNEAAKFLLFRNADPSIKGQYDNALVTALHYNSKNDLLRLLLNKNVDLTARHPDYKKLNLREYCVLTNRVAAKAEIDAYVIRLISHGNYQRLKWLVDHGYTYINVNITPKRNGKQLAKERYYEKIVKLIDNVENTQMKAKIKMNY
ncbi:unnamed protein product [Rotaria sp. Silwood1]|nr:unnamed protein product [Rotaria sp. Silwood1]CAF1060153.1 unnamed protein product [Rotaria sp. Silwood1]CAF1104963.1 unnamed protein product [Rotaria sp. Silwood1]CAF3456684.1 unnamed protein product [Rotaria sp. Silwood1]CAF3462319.1 unnamed protein product [Rotaria sp. Silwood1]